MTEWRKHYSQMTKWEIKRIQDAINNSHFTHTEYSLQRTIGRSISELDIQRVIKFGSIIEFHYKDGDLRVLIRGTEKVNHDSVCVVVSINKKHIVTVYKNDCEDNHYTLHKEIYNRSIDLMRYLSVV